MDKKEIYEHLAKIYLDASSKTSKKKRRSKTHSTIIRNLLITFVLVLTFGAGSSLWLNFNKKASQSSQIALYLVQDAAKINFNFDPAKRETFSLNLNNLNLTKYKTLGFTVRKTNPKDAISLRIEFTNRFNEKSEVYVKHISQKWSEQRINLSQFKNIADWQQMKLLVFSVEEWNAREKSGVLYIDDVRLIK